MKMNYIAGITQTTDLNTEFVTYEEAQAQIEKWKAEDVKNADLDTGEPITYHITEIEEE